MGQLSIVASQIIIASPQLTTFPVSYCLQNIHTLRHSHIVSLIGKNENLTVIPNLPQTTAPNDQQSVIVAAHAWVLHHYTITGQDTSTLLLPYASPTNELSTVG